MAVTIHGMTTHDGKVLSLRERNGYDDSDFLAMVWDDDGPAWIEYATTRAYTYDNHAAIDATPEVVLAYAVWAADAIEASKARRGAAMSAFPYAGNEIVVTKGSRKHAGRVGHVTRLEQHQWRKPVGNDAYDCRARVEEACTGDVFWVNVEHLRVVGYESADIREMAAILKHDHGPQIPGNLVDAVRAEQARRTEIKLASNRAIAFASAIAHAISAGEPTGVFCNEVGYSWTSLKTTGDEIESVGRLVSIVDTDGSILWGAST